MPEIIGKHSMLRPHGHLIYSGGEGPDWMADTVMCAHCGRHGVYRKGCGNQLGHCGKCHGPVCGTPECANECRPIEQRLDLYEAGKTDRL